MRTYQATDWNLVYDTEYPKGAPELMEFSNGGIAIIYNHQHPPVLYGSIAYMHSNEAVDGRVTPQWSAPFLLSRIRSDGSVYYYGTVHTILTELMQCVARVSDFNRSIRDMVVAQSLQVAEQVVLSTIDDSKSVRPVTDQQDSMLEEILPAIAVHVRRLTDIFRIKRSIPVYDYTGVRYVQTISLGKISDLLLHSRYFAVHDGFLCDLFSDKQSLVGAYQTPGHKEIGHKISLASYLNAVFELTTSLTVNDVVGQLRRILHNLSATTPVVDLIFVTQNLFSLAIVLDRVEDDSLLQKFVRSLFDASSDIGSPPSTTANQLQFRLKIENLNTKHIVAQVVIDQNTTECTINYLEFMEIVTSRFGRQPMLAPNSSSL